MAKDGKREKLKDREAQEQQWLDEFDLKYGPSKICHSCYNIHNARIFYGLFAGDEDKWNYLAEQGRAFGGCNIANLNWECNNCGDRYE